MGNDGGSIPLRRELVKEAARNPTTSELRATTLEHLAHAWRTCALSGEILKQPVVSDALGRLFNKDEVIKSLLPAEDAAGEDVRKEKTECLAKASVKGLKDVVEIKFEVDEGSDKKRPPKWICPVTKKELDENTKAVYIVPCGHAFADAAIKMVDDEKCIQCSATFASNDVITIVPTEELDIAHLTLRMQTLRERGLSHSLKKVKKSKKVDKGQIRMIEANQTSQSSIQNDSIQNASTASLTAKVLQEQETRNKKRKADNNLNLESLYAKSTAIKKGRNNDFMSRGFSIPAHQS